MDCPKRYRHMGSIEVQGSISALVELGSGEKNESSRVIIRGC